MKRIGLLFWLIVFFNLSCFTTFFSLRKEVNIKGKRLAVISGLFNESTKEFSSLLTMDLNKASRFSVISQQEIRKANGRYPVKIKGPYETAYFNIEDNYSLGDREKLLRIAKAVRADYAYAVWVPIEGIWNGSIYQMEVIGQMFDIETGQEIGYGKYPINWMLQEGYIGWDAPKSKGDSMRQISEHVAKEIAKLTKMSK